MELPRIFCYARSSSDKQKESPDTQLGRFREKCKEFEEKGEGKLYKEFSEIESASEVPWTERKEFSKLVKELEKGDIVFCWTLSRIDRNPIRMLNFAQFCINREIRLFLLKEPFMSGNEVELNTALGRAFLHMGAIFNDFWMEHHKEAVRTALAWRKKNGLAYTGNPIRGKKRVVKHIQGKDKPVKMDVWDTRTCQLFAEIYTRWKYDKETFTSIALDMNHRRERMSTGGLVCRTRSLHLPPALQTPDYQWFRKIFNWIREEIESHDGMMGDIQTPYYPDVNQMKIKPRKARRGQCFILQD